MRSLFFLFFMFVGSAHCGRVIVVMGASCSGKSTLSNRLLESMGDAWRMVELDVIEEEFEAAGKDTDSITLVREVVRRADQCLADGKNVIIDTNIYHALLRTIAADDQRYILVYCSLNVLLERNAKRDAVLHRSPERAARARAYVEKTFYNFENCTEYDDRVDTSVC